jgi:hypothetical protein
VRQLRPSLATGNSRCFFGMQVKLCRDALCWYCPRIAPHVPPNLRFFPYYTIADGNGGWVPLHERDAMMADTDERVRKLAHELFVTDKWLPENGVLAAWRRNPECDERRVKQVACSTNLAEETVRALYEKLNDDHDRRTQHTRACMACNSEEIQDANLGQILFCDHKQHTRRCLNALHLACCVPALASVPRGKWLCPEHAGTHACSPARGHTHNAKPTHEPWQVLARTMLRARTRGPARPSPHLRQTRTSPRRKRPRPPIQIPTRIRTPVLSSPSGRTWRSPERGHARSAWAHEPSRGLPTISEQTKTLQCAAGATRTRRRMIAPSCSSLGPDARHASAPGALSDRLINGLAPLRQHSATPRQFAIKRSSSAHSVALAWRGGLTRSLTQ